MTDHVHQWVFSHREGNKLYYVCIHCGIGKVIEE